MTPTPGKGAEVVYLFGDRTREAPPPPEAEPKPRHLNLKEYLTLLYDHGYISTVEYDKLYTALGLLFLRFPHITTIEGVREDLAENGYSEKKKVRDAEQALWAKGDLIDNFDLDGARQGFQTSAKDRPEFKVRGITAVIDQQIESRPFVAPDLETGETFFWIILRMCRLQHELDVGVLAEPPADPAEEIADRLLAGDLSPLAAVIATKDQLPPLQAETTTDLIAAANKFVGAADGVVKESKALSQRRRRKSFVEYSLGVAINIIFWGNKWRRIAIDTRLQK